ncbi:hypothetical protein [Micromonospora sp. NBRC 101691]|uniref:hypothetical protein n=1 Tax=Micromonospora sp. NBRC 101691 TaxID=3032198 RepID=UPI0025554A09|nr:hypothetical protein [Micromonospora sp. NBRC 101691]
MALVALAFAALSTVGDLLSTNLRWTAALGGIGLLILRAALPERADLDAVERIFGDRSAFDLDPLTDRLKDAQEVWIYAPSAVNLLSPERCEVLRHRVLGGAAGRARIVVLDPTQEVAVAEVSRQLDDSLDYPLQEFGPSLASVVQQLRRMASWQVAGKLEYGFLSYNPGFSLVAVDPKSHKGVVIVEMHAFHNTSTASRMHLRLTRAETEKWYFYWLSQFERIWDSARKPDDK